MWSLCVLYQKPIRKTEKIVKDFLAVVFFIVMRYPPNRLLLTTTKSEAPQSLVLDF